MSTLTGRATDLAAQAATIAEGFLLSLNRTAARCHTGIVGAKATRAKLRDSTLVRLRQTPAFASFLGDLSQLEKDLAAACGAHNDPVAELNRRTMNSSGRSKHAALLRGVSVARLQIELGRVQESHDPDQTAALLAELASRPERPFVYNDEGLARAALPAVDAADLQAADTLALQARGHVERMATC